MLFTHFYNARKKNDENEICFVSLVNTEYFGIETVTFLSTNWQNQLLNIFLIGVAINIAISMNWCTTAMSFCEWFAALKILSKNLL